MHTLKRYCNSIISGIKSVLVGLLAQKAEVKFDKERIIADEIVCHVREMGFGCTAMDKQGQGENSVELLVSFCNLFIKLLYAIFQRCTTSPICQCSLLWIFKATANHLNTK